MTWTSLQGAQRGCQRPMCTGTKKAQTHYLSYPILSYPILLYSMQEVTTQRMFVYVVIKRINRRSNYSLTFIFATSFSHFVTVTGS
jgi:hypothetical protein